MPTLPEPAAVYTAYNAAENRRDLQSIQSLVATDLRVEVNGRVAVTSAKDDSTAMAALFASYPDYRRELVELLVDGDRATARWRMLGSPVTEGVEPLDLAGCSVVRVAKGQIAQAYLYYDGGALDVVLSRSAAP